MTAGRGHGPAVIVPVHNGVDLLPEAVRSLREAAEPEGGRVIVVDDGSTDRSADVAARHGAEVHRLASPQGPYAARNVGWRAAASDGVEVAVFVDVRCRPRPGWLPALTKALDEPGAAIAAGDVVVRTGTTLAARAAARLQPLSAQHGREAGFLPYAPTCHLAAPTALLDTVGGFREVRGGGDVDFCWRVQLGGFGHLAWADDAVLEWEPRQRLRDLLSQYHRYGANLHQLYLAYRDRGCEEPAPTRVATHVLRAHARIALRSPVGLWPELAVAASTSVAFAVGYARDKRKPGAGVGATG